MLTVTSFNANGIRSAVTKGFLPWFLSHDVDVLCLQELKAQDADISGDVRCPAGYEPFFHFAARKGYSGCAVWTRLPVVSVATGFGVPEFDNEGRYVRVDLENLSIISVYFPSGSMNDDRQASKFRFLEAFLPHLDRLREEKREFLLCGDFNIAHKEIDLKNWKSNRDHSGFLPEERAWMTKLFDECGWVDVFRRLDPNPDRYTWWSQRGRAREKNVGWRIDYQVGTPGIAEKARETDIYAAEKFSDHAPLTIRYEWPL